jgi:hypothetical protein
MYPFPLYSVGTDIHRIQYLAIIGSIAMLVFIFELTRKKKIRIQYAILWFFLGSLFLFFSIWRHGLDVAAKAIGIVYPPAALFLLLILGVFAILVQFSVVISKLSEQNTKLIQELGTAMSKINDLTGEKIKGDSSGKTR